MRRELNEIEYLNWCIGQPFNMVLAVPVRGVLEPIGCAPRSTRPSSATRCSR